MSIFAEIKAGTVSNVAVASAAADLPAGQWIQIDTLTPQPGIGWTYSSGTFTPPTPPAPPAPTLAQQAAALIAAGLTITSTSTSSLDGTYATDPVSQQHISAEVTSILLNDTFTDGTSSIAWLDAAGASHTFTVAQFKTFATAVAAFVSACLKCVNGQSTTLPSASATIA